MAVSHDEQLFNIIVQQHILVQSANVTTYIVQCDKFYIFTVALNQYDSYWHRGVYWSTDMGKHFTACED